MKGRNSIMIGIRVSEAVNTILKELAGKRGVTVSAYVKAKVEDYAGRVVNTRGISGEVDKSVNTITELNCSVNKEPTEPSHSVNIIKTVEDVYKIVAALPKAGVITPKIRKEWKAYKQQQLRPALDAEGNPIPEI